MDKDGNGTLDREEVFAGYEEHFGVAVTEEMVDAMFKAVDLDGNDCIDYTEFVMATMNEKDLINNIGTIANSGTEKFIENLKDNKKDVGALIGQFGIGFYSTFMVADKVTIYSTKAGTKKTYVWESDGSGKYSLSQHNEKLPRGTTVELNIKKDETDLLEDYKIREIIKKYSDHISFPINFINNEKNQVFHFLKFSS